MEDIELFVPEFEYQEKKRIWYLSVIFFALLFIWLAMILNNPTFIGVVTLGTAVLLMRANKKPKMVPFAINDKGIYFKDKLWEYKDIKDFSIYEFAGVNYLVVNPHEKLRTSIKVRIKDTEIVRNKLHNFVSQVEYQESLIDILIRLFNL